MPRGGLSYEDRSRNYQDHQAQNMRTREELMRRGVQDPAGLPTQDTRTATMENYLNSDAPRMIAGRGDSPSAASPELDAQARAAGFPDYATMQAYMMRRSEKTGGSVGVEGARGQNSQREMEQRQQQGNPAAGGIGGIFEYISNALRGAR